MSLWWQVPPGARGALHTVILNAATTRFQLEIQLYSTFPYTQSYFRLYYVLHFLTCNLYSDTLTVLDCTFTSPTTFIYSTTILSAYHCILFSPFLLSLPLLYCQPIHLTNLYLDRYTIPPHALSEASSCSHSCFCPLSSIFVSYF